MTHLISRSRKRQILERHPEVVSIGESVEDGQDVIVIRVEEITDALRDRLPDSIEGAPVVLKESDRITFDGIGEMLAPFGGSDGYEASQVHDSRVRPVQPGTSTGPAEDRHYSGTISFVMTDGDTTYLTSNNHVFAGTNSFSDGRQFTQPSRPDGGDSSGDVIGGLAGYIPLEDGGVVDFGWLEPSVDVIPDIYGLGTVSGQVHSPQVDDPIIESGRTSGISTGTIQEVNSAVSVGFSDPVGSITLEECIISTQMGGPGDSGSPVVLNSGGEPYDPVGLHFAGSSSITVHCTVENATQESGLEIVPSESFGAEFDIVDLNVTTKENVGTVEYTVANNGQVSGSHTVTVYGDIGSTGSQDVQEQIEHTLGGGEQETNEVEFVFQVERERDVRFCATL